MSHPESMAFSPYDADHVNGSPSFTDSDMDFGPDPSSTKDIPPTEEEKPKAKARFFKKSVGNLGNNDRRVKNAPRQLKEKDKEKISALYVTAGMFLMPVKPEAARALANAADECADAWFELAETNHSVRRTILMLIEGGAWGRVMAAHLPIMFALLPAGAFPFPLPNNSTSPMDFENGVANMFNQDGEQ